MQFFKQDSKVKNYTPLKKHMLPQKSGFDYTLAAVLLFLTTFTIALTIFTLTKAVQAYGHNPRTPIAMPNYTESGSISNKNAAEITPDLRPHLTLSSTIESSLAKTKGTYGVVIHNLKTNERFQVNEHTVFQSASLYKLWVMKVVLEEINKGSLSENQQLSRNVIDLNNDFDISSDEADMQDGVISYTVQEALTKMITQSDNYAAYLLTDTVGFDKVKTFLQKYGFSQSSFSQPPKTSAADIAQFFEKLYNGELADAATTQKMLNLLKGQRINGKLPKYLPEEVSIAHKTGELEAFSHDAGIVFSPAGDYSIVILSETNNPPEAVESIATISKDVYNYFNR